MGHPGVENWHKWPLNCFSFVNKKARFIISYSLMFHWLTIKLQCQLTGKFELLFDILISMLIFQSLIIHWLHLHNFFFWMIFNVSHSKKRMTLSIGPTVLKSIFLSIKKRQLHRCYRLIPGSESTNIRYWFYRML